MTYTWHWKVKETFLEDELAKTVSDLAINHTVSGFTPSEGAAGHLLIASGYGRCEGWRVETDGEDYDMTGFADDIYYVYIEITITGNKITSVATTSYTTEQSATNRIYIAEVTIAGGDIPPGGITDKRNLYAFMADKIQISSTTKLSDWRHALDLTKIDGADIYDAPTINESTIIFADTGHAHIGGTGGKQVDHGGLGGLGDHDHSIYPRKTIDETISGQWDFSAAVDFYDGATRRGRIVAYGTQFRLWSDNADFYMQDLNRTYSQIFLEVSTTSGGIYPTTDTGGTIGDASPYRWKSVRACAIVDDTCSYNPEPKNAFEVLALQKTLLTQNTPKDKIHTKDLPLPLRARDRDGKITTGRDISRTLDYLIFAIGDISEKFDDVMNRLNTLELAVALLQP